jgi:hypothetical protein
MERARLTRPWLESLSTVELANIAASWNLDIPEGLERTFIIEELLDTSREDEEPYLSRPLTLGPEIPEPAPLPRQYNITWLDVLVRDPLWVFAFWEIKTADREALGKLPDFEGYCLKVFPVKDAAAKNGPPENAAYVVHVGAEDTSWYLGFPPAESRGGYSRYRLELCADAGNQEWPLARTGPFRLPSCLPGSLPGSGLNGPENRLHILSGLEDLPVLRNTDRVSWNPPAGAFPGKGLSGETGSSSEA